jgi:hypothetical protein
MTESESNGLTIGMPLGHFNRTRYLPDLDKMLFEDRDGAIQDMIQVLRENGIIKTVTAMLPAHVEYASDNGFKPYAQRHTAEMIGMEMKEAGLISYSDRTESFERMPNRLRYVTEGTASVLVPRKPC